MANLKKDTYLKKAFGLRVRQLRKDAALSQEQLAEKSSLSANYIGRIERGDKWVSPEVLDKLAKVLKAKVSDFFLFDEPEREREIDQFDREINKLRRTLKGRPLDDVLYVRESTDKLFKNYRRK